MINTPTRRRNSSASTIRALQARESRESREIQDTREPGTAQAPEVGAGTGFTVFSYLIAGMVAYGAIGWLAGRATHIGMLFPVGMLVGLAISIAFVIYRYGVQGARSVQAAQTVVQAAQTVRRTPDSNRKESDR